MLATMRVRALFDKAWRHLLGLALPPTCAACECALPAAEPVGLCPDCYAKLPWWDVTGVLPPELPKVVKCFGAPLLYDGLARELVLRLKFKDGTHLAPLLARLMLPKLPKGDDWLVVAVPMHRRAFGGRMFNQAVLLARAVARLRRLDFHVDALVRVKPSDGQAKRTRAQRLKLSSHDFVAKPLVRARRVLLVDDIYTTGATARACALALKRGGAAEVAVATVAFTPASLP
ncbi:MAG: ComF family protein [Pseudomonadaceae bacterium]|nr:ComF family protein [Pseudomonadaceae bacterium]